MSITVNITKGFYRGNEVTGEFQLSKPFKETGGGFGHITIVNPNPEPGHSPTQRVKLSKADFTLSGQDGAEIDNTSVVEFEGGKATVETDFEAQFARIETDEEAMERIRATFEMLNTITEASAAGVIRGLVVTGPPGIGKSFGVEETLKAANLFRTLQGEEPRFEFVTGGVSSIGLYQKLYYNRHKEDVIVFDDCDGILFEEEALSLLKGALNSGDTRRICWNKESRLLTTEDIPQAFDFEGSIIFISNIDFEKSIARGSRISAHLEAIMSRCHYLDLEIGSMRDRLLRIKQIINDGMLKAYNFGVREEEAVVNFIYDNSEYLREVSLRMVKKVADLVKANPNDWSALAEATVLTREAKFRRALERRNAKEQIVDMAA